MRLSEENETGLNSIAIETPRSIYLYLNTQITEERDRLQDSLQAAKKSENDLQCLLSDTKQDLYLCRKEMDQLQVLDYHLDVSV